MPRLRIVEAPRDNRPAGPDPDGRITIGPDPLTWRERLVVVAIVLLYFAIVGGLFALALWLGWL